MIDWLSIMERPYLSTIMSVLIGFGIAAIFRPLCKGPECVIIRGPPVHDIRGAVYQYGAKCVEFNTRAVKCPANAVSVVETVALS